MGTLTKRIEQAEKDTAKSGDEIEGIGRVDEREKAIVDRHKSELSGGGLMQKIATGLAGLEIEDRREKRAYAEKPPTALAQMTVDPAREMLANLGDRARVLDVYRKLSPEQRQEALRLAPGIAQIGGDDRGGFTGRVGSAVARGITGVSQPIMELLGGGGSAEEIEFIRKLEGAAAQEFNPALPSDPWYERGPLQAVEMLPWMATTVGGAGLGRAAATGIAGRLATSAAAGSRVASVTQKAGQAIGSLPTKIPVVGKYIPALTAGKAGELAGITAAAFPSQYAQEVDQLKAIGMVDDTRLRLLAGGTAAVTGLVEGIVPNPFGGKVALTEGAAKAARQYLWEAAKKAPGELTEEYLQGVVSGLGEHVAQHIGSEAETKDAEGNVVKTNPAQKKTIADAFSKGWKQAQEAALPMAFLLGGSAVGGAAMSAARATNAPPVGEIGDTMSPLVPPVQALPDRVAKLEEITSKGFVSEQDAAAVGIAGANRKERLANAKSEIEQLKALAASPPSPEVEQPTDVATNEERMRQEEAVKAQYAEEIARRRAAKAQPQLTGDIVSPPSLPNQPASQSSVASTEEKVPPLESAVKPEVSQPYWKRMKQEGKPGKEAMRQTIVDEANRKISASEDVTKPADFSMFAGKQDADKVEAYREVLKESGFDVGPVSYNDKEGTASWNVSQAKPTKRTGRKDEPVPQPAGDIVSPVPTGELTEQKPPDRNWKSDDRVFIQGHTTGSGVKIPNSVGKVRKVNADNVVVQIDGETNLRAVPKDKLQLPDATFEKGEIVGIPWAAEKEAKVTDVLPDGRYELSVAGRKVVEPADRMVKLPATEVKAKPAGDIVSPPPASIVPEGMLSESEESSAAEIDRRMKEKKRKGRKDESLPKEPERPIGVNSRGESIYEDKNGVRSVLVGDVRIEEEVGLRPSRNADGKVTYVPEINKDTRNSRFKTDSETVGKVPEDVVRDQEKQDAPKTKKGGDPNEVQTEGGQKPTEGQVIPEDKDQATGETPSPDSSFGDGITDGFRALPANGRAAFETEWKKGATSIKNVLYPNNKNYRAEFEARTGVKLPKTVGGTFEAVEKWHNEGRKLASDLSVGDGKPKPPKGYKRLKEFTPDVIETKSPDLELQDNRDGIKELGLKKGEAVGYRVYPKRGSSKGGYWQYGTVEYDPTGSHASIRLEDGTVESVGGSRLIRLEQESQKNSENVPARSDKSSELDSKPDKQPKGVGSVASESGGAALPASKQSQHYPDGSAYRDWMSRRHRIGDKPTSFLSGHSSNDVREAAKQNPGLGLVITPANPGYVNHGGDYSHIMIDNGAFSEFTGTAPFSEDKFFALLDKVVAAGLKDKVQHVVVPDKVGDWKGTNERWKQFYERVKAYGMPLAYVGQDGIEQNMDQIPWDQFDVFFIGGSTPWKLGFNTKGEYKDFNRPTDDELRKAKDSREFVALLKEIKRRGKKIHMGRVNSWKRMEIANYGMQVDSADGNFIGAAPNKNLAVVSKWLEGTGGDQYLPAEIASSLKDVELIKRAVSSEIGGQMQWEAEDNFDSEVIPLNPGNDYDEEMFPKGARVYGVRYGVLGSESDWGIIFAFVGKDGVEFVEAEISVLGVNPEENETQYPEWVMRLPGLADAQPKIASIEQATDTKSEKPETPSVGQEIKDLWNKFDAKVNEFFELADDYSESRDPKKIDEVQEQVEALDAKLQSISAGRFDGRSEELRDMTVEQIDKEVAKAVAEKASKKERLEKDRERAKAERDARDAERDAKRKEQEKFDRAEKDKAAKELQDRIDNLSKPKDKASNINWAMVEQIRSMDTVAIRKLATSTAEERYLNDNYDFPEEGTGSQRIVGVRPKNTDVPDVLVTGKSKAEVKKRLLMFADEAVVASYSKASFALPAINQSEFDDAAEKALEAILAAEQKAKPIKKTGRKEYAKAKSGQYVLPGMPGMAEEIDRQDFVRKYRNQALKSLWGWSSDPADAKDIQDAIDTMVPSVSALMNEIYSGKGKDLEDVYEMETYAKVQLASEDIAMDATLMKGLDVAIKQAIKDRPKPSTLKKPRKSEQTKAEAQTDREAAKAAAAALMAKHRSKLTSGVDPELMAETIQVALMYVRAGVKTFKGYVEAIVEDFGDAFAREFAPYMESGWRALRKHPGKLVSDDAGKVTDYLSEKENERQVYDKGDGANQEGASGGVSDQGESRGSAAFEALEETQSGDGEATGATGDSRGLRGGDAGSIQQGSDAVDGNVEDGDVGSTTGEPGDSVAGSGEGGFTRPGDGSGINLAPKSSRPNFHLTDPNVIVGRGLKDKFARNVRALELSQELEESGRPPTQEELEILASYIGWGAFGQELFQGNWNNPKVKKDWESENEWLREHLGEEEWRSAQESIPNAHYTDPEVVSGIWSMIEKMGFKGGRFLEPSFGIGNFAALMPRDIMSRTNFTAIELDKATARMAKILYPQINVQQKGYQDSKTPNDFYDVTATNVPFGDYKIVDRMYRMPYSIHNYFFRKAIDQTKPGGLMVFVTSNMTMDGKEEAKLLRKQLSDRGDLVAAFRFPTGAFEKYAKTKVVADLIIIRKRKPGEEPSPLNKEWIDIVQVDTPSGEKIDINEYWTKHPENILGTLNHGHGTTSGRPGMIVDKPANLEELWNKAVKSVPADILNTERTASEGKERANERKLRQNTVVHQDDELYIAKGEQLIPFKEYVNWYRSGSKEATIKKSRDEIVSLLNVRDSLEKVLEVQGKGEDAAEYRKALNKNYDSFVGKYGPITTSKAIGYLKASGDAIANAVASLESRNANGEYEKRPVFTRTTVRQASRVGEKLNPIDAFALARNNSINIDWDNVAKMSRMPKQDVLSQLQKEGLIYKTGDDSYEAADVFLSGNMSQKIRQLEAAKSEGVAGLDESIKAAKKAMPKPLVYNQIQVSMGAPWVTAEDYSQFFAELLGEEAENTKVLKAIKGWKVDFTTSANKSPAVVTHGHEDVPFSKMVAAAMNNGRVTVFYKDSEGNPHKDEQATLEANAKIDELKDKFKDWIWQSPDRIARLSQAYNEDHRSVAIPDWKNIKVPLLFEGLALQRGDDPFSLRKHQETAVWRAIVSGKGLFAHEVGTGKTLTIASVAIESRRLRLANKPVVFAHNANSQAVYREAQEAYPGAKILYVDNLDSKNKGQAMASIATEDWDLIVIPHSLVENLKMRPETLEKLLQEQMDQLEAAALEAFNEDDSPFKGRMPENLDNIDEDDMKKLKQRTAKELVKERLRLRERIRAAQADAANESTVFIEDMGIDMLLVDEAHIFKKIPLATRQQVKGLNKRASNIGNSLMLLSDYIRGTQNGRGVYLFTGTPITNTLNEIYNMQRFIMPDEMQAVGVKDWDGWFNTFATAETSDELSAGGTYEEFERLTSFVNLPELRASIGQYMDTVFASEMPEFIPRKSKEGRVAEGDPVIGRPYKEVHNETLQMMPIQKRLSEDLKRRYRALRDAKGKAKFEMMRMRKYMPLVINTEGVKLALDPRLMDGVDASQIDPRDPRLKVNKMLLNAMDYYHSDPKATQMIFMEMGHEDTASRTVGRDNDGKPITERVKVFNLAKEIKRRLMEEGVPESEIAIFSAMTKEKRAEAARAMNRGEIRFAIGGTETLGTGINAQENLIAMHHMDAPWMPGALEQRNGRGHRQGNRWNTVHEHRYLTEGPQDGRRWQVLLTKDRFIYRFMHHKGDERVIDMSDVDMDEEGQGDFESTFSAAVGDPRIQQRFKLEREIAKLIEAKDRHHRTIQNSLWEAQKRQSTDIPILRNKLERYLSIQKSYQDSRPENTESKQSVEPVLVLSDFVKLPQKTVVGSDAISEALAYVMAYSTVAEGTKRKIGEYRGVDVFIGKGALATDTLFVGDINLEIKPSFASLDGILRNLEKRIESVRTDLGKKEAFVKSANESSKLPFVRQPQLDAKQKKLKSLIEEIESNPEGSPFWFRNMAPIGTSIYLRKRKRADGMQAFSDMESEMQRERLTGESPQNVRYEFEEHAVSGYRSDTHVLYEDGTETIAVPASKIFNENGDQIFADIEDLRRLNDTSGSLTQAISSVSTDALYQTDDVSSDIRMQALDIALEAEDAGIKTFDKLIAYSVKTVGESRTREIGTYLRLAAEAAGFAGVRQVNDVLGTPNVTREQAVTFAKAAFPMLSDEQIEAGVAIIERIGLLDKIGFAPAGTPIPSLPRSGDSIVRDGEEIKSDRVKGWTQFISATRAVIGATNKADVSTFIHEFFHPTRKFLLDRSIPQDQRFGISDEDIKALEDYSGVKDGKWDRAAEEKAAKAWEQYWFEGQLPAKSLSGLFKKMARWMRSVYNGIYQITGGQLPSEVRSLFDKLVQRSGDTEIGDTMSPIEDSDVTSIKNALVNEGRINRGVPALGDVASQTQQEWLDAADAILQDDPMVGDRLVKELNEKPRNLSNIEVAVMQIHYRQMNNRLEKVSDRLFEAKDDKDAAESAKALTDVDIVMNALAEIEEATKKAGREWGRAGVARQIELERDFSLAAVMRKARIANGGNALSEKQIEEMRELAKRVAQLEGELAKAIQEKLDLERKKNVEAQIEDSKAKVEPVPKAIRKKAVDKLNAFKNKFAAVFASSNKTDALYATEDEQMADEAESVIQAYVDMGIFSLGEFLANIRKDLGTDLPVSVQAAFSTAWKDMHDNGDIPSPMLDKNDVRGLSRLAKQIERSLVEAGITERDKVVKGVHESLQEIIPEITVRETMDAMSGYGQYSQLSDKEADKIIRDINGQLQQLAKLDDMRSGIAPAKTGVERRTMSDEERRLVAQVNEAKRRGGFIVSDPDSQLKSAIAAAKTALRNRIKDLQFEIDRKEKIVRTRTDTKSDSEVIELRKQRDELMKQHKELFPKPEATMDQRIAATSRVLDKVIADLEKQLQTKEFGPKPQAKPISTPEIDAKRARIEALREQRDLLRGVRRRTPEQIEKAYKANLLKQLADYKDRMAKSDFDPKPRREVRVLSQAELDLKRQLQDTKDQFFRMAADYRLANMSPRERAWDYVKETAHLSRALMTSFDFSAVFRQGGTVAFAHPKMAAETSREMYKAMRSAAFEFETAEKIRKDDMYQFAMTAGLQITEEEGKITRQEEAYMGRWARQGIGAQGTKLNEASKKLLFPIAASARGYMTFLNGIRFKLFKHMVSNLGKSGQVTADEAKVIAMYINAATGRSDLGPMMRWAEQMNMLFFAPRFVASRFQYLGMPLWLLGSRNVSGRVKKAIAQEYARHALGVGSFLALTVALGSLLGDDDEEKPTVSLDPRSSDFLKIKLGETRIDPMSGLSQVMVLGSRIASGQRVGADGEVVDLRGEKAPYGGMGIPGTVGNFLRTKLAPIPGAAFDIATGENVVGQPATPFSSITNLFIPLSLREISETAESRGVPQGAVITLLSLHGMGASTYGPESNYRKGTPEQRQKQFDKDLKKITFDSKDPAYKEMLSKDQMSKVEERRQDRRQGLVFAASANPIRKAYKNEESYKTAVSERDASLESLRKSGMSLDEARGLLIKHWDANYGGAKETRRGVRVYKEALADRLRQLRKVFAE